MLAFHVLIHNKYSVVNIITCFAGPTTWGQSRGLGTQQRPGDRAETWGQRSPTGEALREALDSGRLSECDLT